MASTIRPLTTTHQGYGLSPSGSASSSRSGFVPHRCREYLLAYDLSSSVLLADPTAERMTLAVMPGRLHAGLLKTHSGRPRLGCSAGPDGVLARHSRIGTDSSAGRALSIWHCSATSL